MMIETIKDTVFSRLKSIGHAFFTRQGGVSKAQHRFDLLSFVRDDLNRLALKSVTAIGLDTYTNEDLFFSCRRARHRKEPDFGGHLSCIYFNKSEFHA